MAPDSVYEAMHKNPEVPIDSLGCINRGRKFGTRDVFALLYFVLIRQLVHCIRIEISFVHWPLRSSAERNWDGEWNNKLHGRKGTGLTH